MAIPTLSALEEEKKQAQAADEELQVLRPNIGFSLFSYRLQFLRERERRTLLRERARAEKEDGADEDESDEEFDDEDYDNDGDDDDDDDVAGDDSARELRAISSAGALLRQALKSANRKESEFTDGNPMRLDTARPKFGSLCVTAIAKHLPKAVDVGPLQLSAMASAATGNLSGKTAAKTSKAQEIKPRGAKIESSSRSAQPDDDDDSSWGDGSSTEEVCHYFLCALMYATLKPPDPLLFRISQPQKAHFPMMEMRRGRMWMMRLCQVSRIGFEARKSKSDFYIQEARGCLISGCMLSAFLIWALAWCRLKRRGT
jgi:hypothetical protein